MEDKESKKLDTATFGAGCFWCVEAIYRQLRGVERVESGYMGGTLTNPTYKEVCSGNTGHAEVCRIWYDSDTISYDNLLEVFWQIHDPTSLNRQGEDVGTQYRSVVFFENSFQFELATLYKQKLTEEKVFDKPVITEIAQATVFYPAEDYHQNYFNLNGQQPYCSMVVKPKVEKFRKAFARKLR